MDKLDASFDSLVEKYFHILDKKDTKTTESRLVSLRGLRADLLKIYSPTHDDRHILFLGILKDVIYIAEHGLSAKKKVKSIEKVIKSTKDLKNITVIKKREEIKKNAGFGATVFEHSRLREIDCNDLNKRSIINIKNKDYRINFIAKHYLADKKMYEMSQNIYFGNSVDYIVSYNFLVDKHYETKKKVYNASRR